MSPILDKILKQGFWLVIYENYFGKSNFAQKISPLLLEITSVIHNTYKLISVLLLRCREKYSTKTAIRLLPYNFQHQPTYNYTAEIYSC